jgi:alkanesulfonate monooxygenase SsuD/methylene tetrahydromethanopterin reductase-like flavin-dependent oxidoreductase (luciferase family)
MLGMTLERRPILYQPRQPTGPKDSRPGTAGSRSASYQALSRRRDRRWDGGALRIGSWGSEAGLRRVARLGDGWFASAYNRTPEAFCAANDSLPQPLRAYGRAADGFPTTLVTMWTCITADAREAERIQRELLAPLLKRDPGVLRDQLCIGPPEKCAELLSSHARAGCERVHLWPLAHESQQID